VFGQDIGDPLGHLDPEPFHVVLVLSLLDHRIPALGIDPGLQGYPFRLDSGLQRAASGRTHSGGIEGPLVLTEKLPGIVVEVEHFYPLWRD
jgi:hypothetical protein